MSTDKTLSIATEAIEFQGDSFLKQLVADLATLPAADRATASNAEWEKLEVRLEKTVEKRTGLQLNFDIAIDGEASLVTPILDWSHVFHSKMFAAVETDKEAVKFFQKIKSDLNACLDLKKCFVSGTMAKELIGQLQIDRKMLYKEVCGAQFSDEEVSSMILHEVGHFFTMLEFLDRSVSTNQVLAELQRDLLNEKEPSKRTVIIKAAGKDLGIDRSVVQSIEDSDDMVVSTVLISTGVKLIRSESGHSFYDMNTCEMLADQYASRHGAGPHLFSALHKLIVWCPDFTMTSRAAFYFGQAARVVCGLLSFVGAAHVVAVGTPLAVIFGLIIAIFGCSYIKDEDSSMQEPVYDNDFGRLTRLRNQQVHAIKVALSHNKSKFNAAYVKQLTADIAFMDDVLKKGSQDTTIVSKVITFFNANEANRQANTTFQKHLEGLVHNDLYAKAAALKTI